MIYVINLYKFCLLSFEYFIIYCGICCHTLTLRTNGGLAPETPDRGVKNEKLREKALKFCIILLDEKNKNIESIAFKFGILCPSIITNPMHSVI